MRKPLLAFVPLLLLLVTIFACPAIPQVPTRQVALLLVGFPLQSELIEDASREKLTELRSRVGASKADLPILTYHLLDCDEETRRYCEEQLGVTSGDLPFIGAVHFRPSGTGFVPEKVVTRHNRVTDYEAMCTKVLVEATKAQVDHPQTAILIVSGHEHVRVVKARTKVQAILLKNRKLAMVGAKATALLRRSGYPADRLRVIPASPTQIGPLAETFNLQESRLTTAVLVAVDLSGNPLDLIYRLDRVDTLPTDSTAAQIASRWNLALKGKPVAIGPTHTPGHPPSPPTTVRPHPTPRATSSVAVVTQPGPRTYYITLKGPNGAYLSAQDGGGQGRSLVSDRTKVGASETFRLTDLNGGKLRGGDRVTLMTSLNYFFCAEQGGDQEITVNRQENGPWGTFEIFKAGEDNMAEIRSGNGVVFRTEKGRYWTALNGGGGKISANGRAPAAWEVFVLEVRH